MAGGSPPKRPGGRLSNQKEFIMSTTLFALLPDQGHCSAHIRLNEDNTYSVSWEFIGCPYHFFQPTERS